MSGETDLKRLLAEMEPMLHDGEYVYCTVEGRAAAWFALEPIGTFRENEGITLILERARAEAAGLSYGPVLRLITLSVHSALEAVGLTDGGGFRRTDAGGHQRQCGGGLLPRPHLRARGGREKGRRSVADAQPQGQLNAVSLNLSPYARSGRGA
jgi:hypothetical protein